LTGDSGRQQVAIFALLTCRSAAGQIPVGDQRQDHKALSLKVLPSLLAQAKEVIEWRFSRMSARVMGFG
jgi:hypothetical protein